MKKTYPPRTYRLLEFLEDGLLVKNMNDDTVLKLTVAHLPKYAIVGDIIQCCEHHYYDIIDENGDFLYR